MYAYPFYILILIFEPNKRKRNKRKNIFKTFLILRCTHTGNQLKSREYVYALNIRIAFIATDRLCCGFYDRYTNSSFPK